MDVVILKSIDPTTLLPIVPQAVGVIAILISSTVQAAGIDSDGNVVLIRTSSLGNLI